MRVCACVGVRGRAWACVGVRGRACVRFSLKISTARPKPKEETGAGGGGVGARAAAMEVVWILLIVIACLTALILCCARCAVKRFAPENTRGPQWEVNSKGERWVPAANRKPRDSRGWIWAEINPEAPPRLPVPPKRPGSPVRPGESAKVAPAAEAQASA